MKFSGKYESETLKRPTRMNEREKLYAQTKCYHKRCEFSKVNKIIFCSGSFQSFCWSQTYVKVKRFLSSMRFFIVELCWNKDSACKFLFMSFKICHGRIFYRCIINLRQTDTFGDERKFYVIAA